MPSLGYREGTLYAMFLAQTYLEREETSAHYIAHSVLVACGINVMAFL